MADSIARVELYSVVIPNKAGEGARVLGALCEGGADLAACWGYPIKGKDARLDIVPKDPAALKKAARKAKLALGGKQVAFHVSGEDRPGALGTILAKLAEAGINIHAVQAVTGAVGSYGAVISVKPEDIRKAAKALGIK